MFGRYKKLILATLLLCFSTSIIWADEEEDKTEKEVASTEVDDDSASQDDKPEKKIVALAELTNLQALQEELDSQKKVLLLEFSASYCGYCKVLERSYLKPMLTDPLYTGKVLIRKIDIDSAKPLIDFDGKEISVSDFMLRYKAGRLTPTMIFLDQTGNEVAERMIGFNTPDFFGAYLDQAIDKGVETIRKEEDSPKETTS